MAHGVLSPSGCTSGAVTETFLHETAHERAILTGASIDFDEDSPAEIVA